MVSVIAKVPITGGRYEHISHKEVIQLLVDTCSISHTLVAAIKAVGDIMGSDYHGNSPFETMWYKSCYLKVGTTRWKAIFVLMDELKMLKSLEGRNQIMWGAEMSTSNRPPPKNSHALALQQREQRVAIDGPQGPIEISKFQKWSIDDIPAMASNNASFDDLKALREVASNGGDGIQELLSGQQLQVKMSMEQFCVRLNASWFAEDWPAITNSPMMTQLGHKIFACELESYHGDITRMLAACVLPMQGLTICKANCNFSTDTFNDPSHQLDIYASFSTCELCICNVQGVPSRLEWTGFGHDEIINDVKHLVGGQHWPAHNCNLCQFFTITAGGLVLKENSFGVTFQQKLDPLSQSEIEQFCVHYFNRLTSASGTGAAYRDARTAIQMQQAMQMNGHPAVAAPAQNPHLQIEQIPYQLTISSPGISQGKWAHHASPAVAAPAPAPAPMVAAPSIVPSSTIGAPIQLDPKYWGPGAMQQMQQKQQSIGHFQDAENLRIAQEVSLREAEREAEQQRQVEIAKAISLEQQQHKQHMEAMKQERWNTNTAASSPAAPPVPPAHAPPASAPSAHPNAGVPQILGQHHTQQQAPAYPTQGFGPGPSSMGQQIPAAAPPVPPPPAGHPPDAILQQSTALPPHLRHLQHDKDKWDQVWAARAAFQQTRPHCGW